MQTFDVSGLWFSVPVNSNEGGRRGGGWSGHRSQRFKTQNHKSQSFHMMISQITDNEFS